MARLDDEYKKIITDIEHNIKDENELEYVKEQFDKMLVLFINQMDNYNKITEERINSIENKQSEIDYKIKDLTSMVDGIENELYMDDEEDNFNIVCPYCNFEFTEEFDETKTEIQCPECKNIIELDWNDNDDGCSGHCSGCHGCGDDFEDEN